MVIQSIFRRTAERNQKRIEMTDVIRRQQKSAGAIYILSAKHVNTRDTAKHESHQQLASVIHGPFSSLRFECVAASCAIEKLFFQAD